MLINKNTNQRAYQTLLRSFTGIGYVSVMCNLKRISFGNETMLFKSVLYNILRRGQTFILDPDNKICSNQIGSLIHTLITINTRRWFALIPIMGLFKHITILKYYFTQDIDRLTEQL